MDLPESSGFPPPPPVTDPPFDFGLNDTDLTVATDLGLGAVLLSVPERELEIVLCPSSAVDLVMKLITSLHRLAQEERGYE